MDADGRDEATIAAYLGTLDAEALRWRLLRVAHTNDGLRRGLLAEASAAGGTSDVRALKREITELVPLPSDYVSWRGASEFAAGADVAIELVEGVLEAGHAIQAIALAEHVMRRIDRALDRIDDSSGYVGVVVDRSADLHRRACEAARPDPRKLAARMLELALASSNERI